MLHFKKKLKDQVAMTWKYQLSISVSELLLK